jgi:hypothetical protein
VIPLLAPGQARDERAGELGEAFGGPVEDLRGDAALLEQLLHAEPVTPVHRPPPGRAALAGRLFYITPWSFSTISDSRITQGASFSRTGSFSSPATGSFTAAVDFGDGSGFQPLALSPADTFALSHTYTCPGTFTVTVAVTDPFGQVGTQTLTVKVTAPPLVSGFGIGRDAFVIALYTEDLERFPEPTGLHFWSGRLAAGVKPKTAALVIWRSPEHRALVNPHLVPSVSFQRSYADAIRAARQATLPPRSHPAGLSFIASRTHRKH